jgi:O-antigen biosynthesis protein WbqP
MKALKRSRNFELLKRVFDFVTALILAGIMALPLIIIAFAVKLTSPGPAIYWSDRVGKNNRIFSMPKFRTMRIGAPDVATHLLQNVDNCLTPLGSFLRKTSLDELPQLWSVIIGDMSFVGPRPALFNQNDLIKLRTQKEISKLPPGITGWAQINGRDDISISVKVLYDEYYLKNRSFSFDLKILWNTIFKVIKKEGVTH